MRPEVIAGIFALSGVVIGAFINGLFEYFKTRREKAKKEVAFLCGQMISFCNLEKKYIEEIIKLRAEKGIEAKEKALWTNFAISFMTKEESELVKISVNSTP